MSENLKSPLIIAHRGASLLAPENTLAAFRQAISDNADGLEFDVQLAADGVPIVFHDFTLDRMARRKISTSKLTATELKNVDVGAWFNQANPARAKVEFSGATVSTLAEILEFLKGYRGRIYVELKCRRGQISALVEEVVREIQATDLLPQIIVKSFTLEAISKAKNVLPEIRTAALFAPKLMHLAHRRNYLIEQAKAVFADELSIHYSLAKPGLMQHAKAENMRVTIWTADLPLWVKRAQTLGIFAIITNNPARLLEKRADLER